MRNNMDSPKSGKGYSVTYRDLMNTSRGKALEKYMRKPVEKKIPALPEDDAPKRQESPENPPVTNDINEKAIDTIQESNEVFPTPLQVLEQVYSRHLT